MQLQKLLWFDDPALELASSWILTAPSVALQVFLKSSPLPCDSPWHLDGHQLQTSAQAFHISPWNNFSEVARLPLANCFHSNKFHFFFKISPTCLDSLLCQPLLSPQRENLLFLFSCPSSSWLTSLFASQKLKAPHCLVVFPNKLETYC